MPTPNGRPWPSEPVATSTHGSDRRRVALEPAAELAEGEQLLVRDRARRLVERVEQRRGVALREDQVVVRRVVGLVEVVAQVLREQHRHQVGRRHRRGRVARLRCGGGADRVDAQLLAQLAPALRPVHAGNVTVLCESRSPSTIAASSCASACSRRSPRRARAGRSRHRRARAADRLPRQGAEVGEAIRSGEAERGVLSAARASARRSPPASSPGSARRSATTRTRRTRASSTTT